MSARTKAAYQEALDELPEEMGRAPKATRMYTVNHAAVN